MAAGRGERLEMLSSPSSSCRRIKNKHDIGLSIVTAGTGMGSLTTPIPRPQWALSLSSDTFYSCRDSGCCMTAEAQKIWDTLNLLK